MSLSEEQVRTFREMTQPQPEASARKIETISKQTDRTTFTSDALPTLMELIDDFVEDSLNNLSPDDEAEVEITINNNGEDWDGLVTITYEVVSNDS